jgi:hypothetical protein
MFSMALSRSEASMTWFDVEHFHCEEANAGLIRHVTPMPRADYLSAKIRPTPGEPDEGETKARQKGELNLAEEPERSFAFGSSAVRLTHIKAQAAKY